jgi:hypothetical protein
VALTVQHERDDIEERHFWLHFPENKKRCNDDSWNGREGRVEEEPLVDAATEKRRTPLDCGIIYPLDYGTIWRNSQTQHFLECRHFEFPSALEISSSTSQ